MWCGGGVVRAAVQRCAEWGPCGVASVRRGFGAEGQRRGAAWRRGGAARCGTAAVLQLPPSSVVSKSALAAFKEQHAAMCRVNAAAKLTTKMDPTSAEAPDVKPPAQTDAPVKSEQ